MEINEFNISANLNTPIRIVFVSDLHGVDNKPIIDAILSAKPDYVLVGGDFIHNNTIYKEGINFLVESSKIVPTFCVYGNHENVYRGDLQSLINQTGATLLNDQFVQRGEIFIGGLKSANCLDGKKHSKSIANLDFLHEFEKINGYKILMCHHPEYYDKYLKNKDINLILSGHAHGGQWRFFNRGVYSPGQGLFPKYTSGLYHGKMLVSRGIGNPHKIPRIFNKPEILIINLT